MSLQVRKRAALVGMLFREDVAQLQELGQRETDVGNALWSPALNNFANTLQMGLGIEPDFETLPVFEKEKVNLSGAARTPIAGQVVVNLFDVLLDADAGASGLRRAYAKEKTCIRALVDVAVALMRVSATASEPKENISDGLDKTQSP